MIMGNLPETQSVDDDDILLISKNNSKLLKVKKKQLFKGTGQGGGGKGLKYWTETATEFYNDYTPEIEDNELKAVDNADGTFRWKGFDFDNDWADDDPDPVSGLTEKVALIRPQYMSDLSEQEYFSTVCKFGADNDGVARFWDYSVAPKGAFDDTWPFCFKSVSYNYIGKIRIQYVEVPDNWATPYTDGQGNVVYRWQTKDPETGQWVQHESSSPYLVEGAHTVPASDIFPASHMEFIFQILPLYAVDENDGIDSFFGDTGTVSHLFDPEHRTTTHTRIQWEPFRYGFNVFRNGIRYLVYLTDETMIPTEVDDETSTITRYEYIKPEDIDSYTVLSQAFPYESISRYEHINDAEADKPFAGPTINDKAPTDDDILNVENYIFALIDKFGFQASYPVIQVNKVVGLGLGDLGFWFGQKSHDNILKKAWLDGAGNMHATGYFIGEDEPISGGGGGFNPSTDEQVAYTYIDPITQTEETVYVKTFSFTANSGTTGYFYSFGQIKRLIGIDSRLSYVYSGSNTYPIPFYQGTSYYFVIRQDSGLLGYQKANSFICEGVATVYYTKNSST